MSGHESEAIKCGQCKAEPGAPCAWSREDISQQVFRGFPPPKGPHTVRRTMWANRPDRPRRHDHEPRGNATRPEPTDFYPGVEHVLDKYHGIAADLEDQFGDGDADAR